MELGFLSGARCYWPVKMALEDVVHCICSDKWVIWFPPWTAVLSSVMQNRKKILKLSWNKACILFFLLPVGKIISGSLSPANLHWGCSDHTLGAASADEIPASALPLLLCGRAAFAAARWTGFRKLKYCVFFFVCLVFFPLWVFQLNLYPAPSSGSPWSYTKYKGQT